MILSQLLKRIRFRVNESDTKVSQRKWSDDELVVYTNACVMDMNIRQAEVNETFHNFMFSIADSAPGVQTLWTRIKVYPLPTWVYRPNSVRFMRGGSSTGRRRRDIPARTLHNREGHFWTHDGLHRIRVYGAQETGIEIECSKLPARLNEGTVAASTDTDFRELASGATWLRFAHDSVTYEVELEKDAYANGIFEFTGVDVAGHVVSGQRRRGIASTSKFTKSGRPYTEVTIDRAWDKIPTAGDTWSMHPEAHEAHMELVVLKVAEKCWQRHPNPTAQAALANDLAREERRFETSIALRQDQQINFTGMDQDESIQENDPDRLTGRLIQ